MSLRPDGLLAAVALIIEEVCRSNYDRQTGLRPALTQEEWDQLNERWNMLYLLNKPRAK